MKHTIVLVGPSGSGKTYFGKCLESVGYVKLVTDTTRDSRQGEINGVDYNFVSKKHLQLLTEQDLSKTYIVKTDYAGELYGLSIEEYLKKYFEENKYIILDYAGALEYKLRFKDTVIMYMEADKNILKERMEKRGDNEQSIKKRMRMFEEESNQRSKLVTEGNALVVDSNAPFKDIFSELLKYIK